MLLFLWYNQINLDNILIDEKLHKNILICGISNKTLISSKPLRIRFDKIDGIIIIYDGTRYLTNRYLKSGMLMLIIELSQN